ncbi:MAG: hypothetical protein IJY56_02585 [Clostridia bacterium]|nr:hypothetical protein [Clostridia bacterium]
MRASKKNTAWKRFTKTGAINDYLAYCEAAKELSPEEIPDEIYDRRTDSEGKLHGGKRSDNNRSDP